jgi:hypothetical protein
MNPRRARSFCQVETSEQVVPRQKSATKSHEAAPTPDPLHHSPSLFSRVRHRSREVPSSRTLELSSAACTVLAMFITTGARLLQQRFPCHMAPQVIVIVIDAVR